MSNGKLVYKMPEVPKNAIVLNTCLANPQLAINRVNAFCLDNIHLFSFARFVDTKEININPKMFMFHHEEFLTGLKEKQEKFEKVFKILKDDLSKKNFHEFVKTMLTSDLLNFTAHAESSTKQYFEAFLNLDKDEVFVDAGGFDGETTKDFMELCPEYKYIYFLEPVLQNMDNARIALSNKKKIRFLKNGLSDKKTTAYINEDSAASYVSTTSDHGERINLVTLDSISDIPPTFIKMDIEGSEVDAIFGGSKTIGAYTPKMAVCVYHKPDDLWRIPEAVMAINPNYDIYLRKYTDFIYELVMFFIPKK